MRRSTSSSLLAGAEVFCGVFMDSLFDEEIEVTSSMLEAGRWALEVYQEALPGQELAVAVYRAMERSRREGESESSSNVHA